MAERSMMWELYYDIVYSNISLIYIRELIWFIVAIIVGSIVTAIIALPTQYVIRLPYDIACAVRANVSWQFSDFLNNFTKGKSLYRRTRGILFKIAVWALIVTMVLSIGGAELSKALNVQKLGYFQDIFVYFENLLVDEYLQEDEHLRKDDYLQEEDSLREEDSSREEVAAPTESPVPTDSSVPIRYFVTSKGLNLRTEPNANAGIVTALAQNEIVYFYLDSDSEIGDWLYVSYEHEGTTVNGYVNKNYLSDME